MHICDISSKHLHFKWQNHQQDSYFRPRNGNLIGLTHPSPISRYLITKINKLSKHLKKNQRKFQQNKLNQTLENGNVFFLLRKNQHHFVNYAKSQHHFDITTTRQPKHPKDTNQPTGRRWINAIIKIKLKVLTVFVKCVSYGFVCIGSAMPCVGL